MSYAELLEKSWNEIPQVQVLPAGTYLLKCRGASFKEPADGNPYFMFVYEVVSALDDVDPAALEELGSDYDLSSNRIYYKIWVETVTDLDKGRAHIAKHGVDTTSGSPKESLKAVKGQLINAYLGIKHFTDRTGELRTDNDPIAFTPVE